MSIKPLDLQTLFMQMGHVHKQQAAEKDTATAGETYRRIEAEKRTSKEAKTVHAKDGSELDSGSVKSSTEKEDSPLYQERQGGETSTKHQETADTEDKEVVRDPGLGQNIDVSG